MNKFSLLRQKAGLTIPEVAKLTGYTERTIYRWEDGITTPKKAVFELVKSVNIKNQIQLPLMGFEGESQKSSFQFIDLFAGIGGMRLGFEAIGGKCIFTSEWNTYSQKTYRANFDSHHELAGDITKIEAKDIPSHDVLLVGFPCQPFSIAGVSKKNALRRENPRRLTL